MTIQHVISIRFTTERELTDIEQDGIRAFVYLAVEEPQMINDDPTDMSHWMDSDFRTDNTSDEWIQTFIGD